MGAGVYLAEKGDGTIGNTIRFMAEVLSGVPSIVIGIVAYALVVMPMGHFSALAGGVALAILMIPTLARATEELVRLVPGVAARGLAGPGSAQLEDQPAGGAPHRDGRDRHRLFAGRGPGRR